MSLVVEIDRYRHRLFYIRGIGSQCCFYLASLIETPLLARSLTQDHHCHGFGLSALAWLASTMEHIVISLLLAVKPRCDDNPHRRPIMLLVRSLSTLHKIHASDLVPRLLRPTCHGIGAVALEEARRASKLYFQLMMTIIPHRWIRDQIEIPHHLPVYSVCPVGGCLVVASAVRTR